MNVHSLRHKIQRKKYNEYKHNALINPNTKKKKMYGKEH